MILDRGVGEIFRDRRQQSAPLTVFLVGETAQPRTKAPDLVHLG